jgi:hypothetical protein
MQSIGRETFLFCNSLQICCTLPLCAELCRTRSQNTLLYIRKTKARLFIDSCQHAAKHFQNITFHKHAEQSEACYWSRDFVLAFSRGLPRSRSRPRERGSGQETERPLRGRGPEAPSPTVAPMPAGESCRPRRSTAQLRGGRQLCPPAVARRAAGRAGWPVHRPLLRPWPAFRSLGRSGSPPLCAGGARGRPWALRVCSSAARGHAATVPEAAVKENNAHGRRQPICPDPAPGQGADFGAGDDGAECVKPRDVPSAGGAPRNNWPTHSLLFAGPPAGGARPHWAHIHSIGFRVRN